MEDTFFGENEPYVNVETGAALQTLDPLRLELDDQDFVDVMKEQIKLSQDFFKKKDVYKRRETLMEYYLGQQIKTLEDKKLLKDHETRYLDNLIWEAEQTLKPIALSRIPDLLVKPGRQTPDSKELAESLTEVINNQMRKRETRRVLGMAYRHRPLNFIGIIKYFWNKEKGRHGDYEYQCVHPKLVDFDHRAPVADANDMSWIVHYYDLNIKEIFIRFPNAKAEYTKKMGLSEDDIKSEKKLATPITIAEIWFTWFEKNGDKYEKVEGTAWVDLKKDFVFKKMRNPNWDWEGEKILFNYNEETGEAREINEMELRDTLMGFGNMEGQLRGRTIYRNHFEQPEKPFIFLAYEQMGEMPLDVTSRVEQVIYLQDNVNKRGKQISDIASHARGKNVFSAESGLTKDDIELIDMSNPDQDIFVKGKINEVWSFIPGVQPTAALFEEQEMTRERVFAKVGAHATTRGEREADETATGRQILREADFTKQDDEVEDTINYAAEKMADAALQMIKLRYTQDHLIRILGDKGKVVFQRINQDFVEDGMEVTVAASAVDKMRRKREAFELAQISMTDPLSFFEDIESPDPKDRAERLMIFTLSPEMYFQKYIEGNQNMGQMATALNGQPPAGGGAAAAGGGGVNPQAGNKAMMDIAQLQQGVMPQPPNPPDKIYLDTINRYLQSQEFAQASPRIRQVAAAYAKRVANMVV